MFSPFLEDGLTDEQMFCPLARAATCSVAVPGTLSASAVLVLLREMTPRPGVTFSAARGYTSERGEPPDAHAIPQDLIPYSLAPRQVQ